jgi:aminoglycoside/choline kinase family phosphotransferase
MSEVRPHPSETPGERARQAAAWAASKLGRDRVSLQAVSGDASFRRYFRVHDGDRSLIVMDAPPDKEDSAPFVDIAQRLRDAGLRAPRIFEFDLERGFGLLEDFGDTLYREIIDEDSIDDLMPGLLETLHRMATKVNPARLPDYHSLKLQQELALFPDWYLRVHKRRPFRHMEWLMWNDLCVALIRSANQQPHVFVHRDFHSCNLLRTADGRPGIIDFQDGVYGPVSYDLVSLLWDRYIAWPRERLEGWMMTFHRQLGLDCEPDTWIRWCDLMGLQRNLKIVGIFARLCYRDGKSGYVEMIPRFYRYLLDVLPRYPEYHEFQRLLEQTECAP